MAEYIDPITPIIEAISRDVTMNFDNAVMRAVQEVGIVVDKDRLEQALTDAHKFYEEGYTAGTNASHRHGYWVPLYYDGELYKDEDYDFMYCCSICGHSNIGNSANYCPHCGVKIDRGIA